MSPTADASTSPGSLTIDDLIARAEITDVLQRYVRGIDRVDLELVEQCFHSDGYDDHNQFRGTPAEFVAWLRPRLGRHAATMHFLSVPLIRIIDADLAQSDTYCVAHQVSPPNDEGVRTAVAEGLRYLDRFERRNGEWRIAHRQIAIDFRYQLTVDSVGGPPFPDGWRIGQRGRTDPSYGDVPTSPTA